VQFDATVPTFEDKIAQRAVAMVLEAIYEQDFLPCWYGFRPGRSAHQALRELYGAATRLGQSPSLGSSIITPRSANLSREEPEAGNLHVRHRGG